MRKKNIFFYNQGVDNQGGISKSNLETPNKGENTLSDLQNLKGDEKVGVIPFYSQGINNQGGITQNNLETYNIGETMRIIKIVPYVHYVEYDSKNKMLLPGAQNTLTASVN